ncbi:MAG: VCBS repeat-containing protein [Bryobacterales bacterium]|nr:VCBS repeat-containing protein [Bryobacterales bacterium]
MRGALAPLLLAAHCIYAQDDYRVRAKPPRAAEVERILARTDAFQDHWLGEQDYEAINAIIQRNKTALPWPPGLLARFRKLEVFELKIIASNRAQPADLTTQLGLRIELGGEAADGSGRLSLTGPAQTTFARTSPSAPWTPQRLDLGRLAEVREPGPSPRFRDVTARALGHTAAFREQLSKGLDEWRTVMDEATGVDVYGHNGIAVGDYNGDGLEDLYVSQPAGLPNRLLRNNGNGTFDDVSAATGVNILDATSMALFADFDNDGDQDLLLVMGTQLVLLANDGAGRFTRRTNAGFGPATAALTSAAIADFDRDGWLDIYVCAYDFWTAGTVYDAPTPYYDATNGPPNQLYRNRGNGTFEDVTARSGMNANNNRFSFAASWADYDQDGWPDLYVANDFGRNNLYRNRGDGTFEDVSARAGVEDLGAGMSVAWGDYDGDGWLDLYVSNMWSSAGQRLTGHPAFATGVAADGAVQEAFRRQAKGNSLFRNRGDGTFEDVSARAGVEFGRWAWGSGFADYDNDGRLDLIVKNGYITGPDTHDL